MTTGADMPTILDRIVEETKSGLLKKKRKVTLRDFESFELYHKERRSLSGTLKADKHVSVIAEIKKASPSKGLIRPDFNYLEIAKSYEENGASGISVLTDEPFFKGSLSYLENISKVISIPLLRKDFILDPYQVFEARAYGADAVLLIATIVSEAQLSELLAAVKEAGLEALVECYSRDDKNKLNWEQVRIFGVNNRNLHTFEVNLHQGIELLNEAPSNIVKVSESGLKRQSDLNFLNENEIDAALIGEHLMRQPDPGKALKELLNVNMINKPEIN